MWGKEGNDGIEGREGRFRIRLPSYSICTVIRIQNYRFGIKMNK